MSKLANLLLYFAAHENTGYLVPNSRDLTILGRQRDDDSQNKLLQINGSKDNSSYIINRMNLIQP
jgi:hypothetical protein